MPKTIEKKLKNWKKSIIFCLIFYALHKWAFFLICFKIRLILCIKPVDNENPDEETPEEETPEEETPDEETPDEETPDEETPDEETPDDEILIVDDTANDDDATNEDDIEVKLNITFVIWSKFNDLLWISRL